MLKQYLKLSAKLFVILLGLFACARFFDVSLGGIYDGLRAPYLQMLNSESVIIRWQTAKPSIGVVRISKNLHQVDSVYSEDKADDEHQIRITGLEPDTLYYYSVGTKRYAIYEGESYRFRTSNADKTTTRFWVTGDQGQAGEIQNNVRDAMIIWSEKNPIKGEGPSTASNGLDFWLTTGDNAYRSGTNQQFQDNFFKPYESILKRTPVWPIYGNHDARRRAFFNIFSFPTKAELGGVASNTEHYYSFDHANLHVVVLDSQSSRIQKNSKMLRWLKKDLAATKQQWLIAVFHHPPFTKGSHNSDNLADSFNRMRNIRQFALPILEQHGVDVVLAGHSHMYERSWFMNCHYSSSDKFNKHNIQDGLSDEDNSVLSESVRIKQKDKIYRKKEMNLSALSGTVYITIGSSARLDNGDLNHPVMPISLHQSGSLIFDVVNNTLTANFINQNAEKSDSFTIIKGADNAPLKRDKCI